MDIIDILLGARLGGGSGGGGGSNGGSNSEDNELLEQARQLLEQCQQQLEESEQNLAQAQDNLSQSQENLKDSKAALDQAQLTTQTAMMAAESAQTDAQRASALVDEAQGAIDQVKEIEASAQAAADKAQAAADSFEQMKQDLLAAAQEIVAEAVAAEVQKNLELILQQFQELSDKIDALPDYESRVSTLETLTGEMQTQLTDVSASVESAVQDAAEAKATADEAYKEASGVLGIARQAADDADEALKLAQQNQKDIADILDDIISLTASITKAADKADLAWNRAEEAYLLIGSLQSTVSDYTGLVNQMEETLNQMQTEFAEVTNNVTTLQNVMQTTQESVAALDERVEGAEGRLDALAELINMLEANLPNIGEFEATLQEFMNSTSQKLSDLQTNVTDIQLTFTQQQEAYIQVAEDLTNVINNVTNLKKEVKEVKQYGRVAAKTEHISDLDSERDAFTLTRDGLDETTFLVKNYVGSGNNTDGSMTQKAITDYVERVKSLLEDEIQNYLPSAPGVPSVSPSLESTPNGGLFFSSEDSGKIMIVDELGYASASDYNLQDLIDQIEALQNGVKPSEPGGVAPPSGGITTDSGLYFGTDYQSKLVSIDETGYATVDSYSSQDLLGRIDAIQAGTTNVGSENAGKLLKADEQGNVSASLLDEAKLLEMVEKFFSGNIPKPPSSAKRLSLECDYENRKFTRLDDAANYHTPTDFDAYPMYGGRKRCVVDDSGRIVAFEDEEGFVEDGSAGQVMVYQPKFYYGRANVTIGTENTGMVARKETLTVSEEAMDGLQLHPLFQSAAGELDYVLLGAYEASKNDDKLESVVGAQPVVSTLFSDLESAAESRSEGWILETLEAFSAQQMLMTVEYGCLNMQQILGEGVSNAEAPISTGSTSNLHSTSGKSSTTAAISYRGVENPYGNVYHLIGNAWLENDGTQLGGIVHTSSGAFHKTKLPAGGAYISCFGYDPSNLWMFIPALTSTPASSYAPVGDYCITHSGWEGRRLIATGGRNDGGTMNGIFMASYAVQENQTYEQVGARIMHIPTKDSAVYTANVAKWKEVMGNA